MVDKITALLPFGLDGGILGISGVSLGLSNAWHEPRMDAWC
jgi:hypothetical protein